MAEYPDLVGKVVLVTGGANGIGAATVRSFASQGAKVYFCDILKKAGAELARNLPNSDFTTVDLAKEKNIVRWVERVGQKERAIHVLVNNAAIDPRIPLPELTTKKFDELMAINVRALFVAVRCALPSLVEGSSIVNLGSITFHTGPVHMSAYVATKGAVLAATRALARELGPAGIRVNTVSPGWIMTERQLRDYVDAGVKKLIRKSQCIPDLLQPEEIAEVVLYLASNASRAITGQEILADRGWIFS